MKDTLGKPTVENFNLDTQNAYNAIQARRRELQLQIPANQQEQEHILGNMGVLIAERCDYGDLVGKLSALRAEAEALQAGVRQLDNRAELMKRLNPWLK